MFNALLIQDKDTETKLATLEESQLPEGEVLVAVEYSTINYKDGLAICGLSEIVREWPMVPGIDLAGKVESSTDPNWKPGDLVTVNGWDMGEARFGGLAQKARVKAEHLTSIPPTFSTYEAAAIGTAGYTAMLCVLALEEHGLTPASDKILVTGSAGGVGSVALAVLSKLGYEVTASSGRADTEGDYLKQLGASEIINRSEIAGPPKGFMSRANWKGCVDAVGGDTLATVLTQIKMHGAVAACGVADSPTLNTSVIPFILRAISLIGINCVYESSERRDLAWKRLAEDLNPELLKEMSRTVSLTEAKDVATKILEGKIRGRVVVDVNA